MIETLLRYSNEMLILTQLLLLLNFSSLIAIDNGQDHSILKRSLLFPRSTVLQFTFGVSAPLILRKRAINLSLCLQANYDTPSNLSQLHTRIISAKSNDYPDLSRLNFYKYITKFIDSIGLDGRHCLLRTICELAEHPMNLAQTEGLLEQIVHFLFTPSLDMSSDDVFKTAETHGKRGGNCRKSYDLCPISVIDLFTAKFFNK